MQPSIPHIPSSATTMKHERQVENLKARLTGGSRLVSAMEGDRLVALAEMRAGKLNPVRVFLQA